MGGEKGPEELARPTGFEPVAFGSQRRRLPPSCGRGRRGRPLRHGAEVLEPPRSHAAEEGVAGRGVEPEDPAGDVEHADRAFRTVVVPRDAPADRGGLFRVLQDRQRGQAADASAAVGSLTVDGSHVHGVDAARRSAPIAGEQSLRRRGLDVGAQLGLRTRATAPGAPGAPRAGRRVSRCRSQASHFLEAAVPRVARMTWSRTSIPIRARPLAAAPSGRRRRGSGWDPSGAAPREAVVSFVNPGGVLPAVARSLSAKRAVMLARRSAKCAFTSARRSAIRAFVELGRSRLRC